MTRDYTEKCFNEFGRECEVCGSRKTIQTHHIDGDRSNDNIENLIPLCASCHMKVHRGIDDSPKIERLRSHLPDESIVPRAPSRGRQNIHSIYVREPVYELLTDLMEEYGYKTHGSAVNKIVFEAGYDV